MHPSPNPCDLPVDGSPAAGGANSLGSLHVAPIEPVRGMLGSAPGSWGLAASVAIHLAAVAAFGGWATGWIPGWIPPPAGISSQAQSGEQVALIAAAPASRLEELQDAPPVKIEVEAADRLQELPASPQPITAPRAAAGRPLEISVSFQPIAIPIGDEQSRLRHEVPAAGGVAEAAGAMQISEAQFPKPFEALPRRSLATDRPTALTLAIGASAPSAIGSRAQAGAKTNAAPRAVFSPEPIYPPQALAAGQKGKVMVRIRVDGTGAVIAARIQATSGNTLLDEAALAAVRRWRFEARGEAGRSPVELAVPIAFDIEKME